MRRELVTRSRALRAASRAASACSSTRRASLRNTAPASVRETLRWVRFRSRTPSSSSSLRTCSLTAGWATCSRSAARRKCNSSATATKYLRCRSSMFCHPFSSVRQACATGRSDRIRVALVEPPSRHPGERGSSWHRLGGQRGVRLMGKRHGELGARADVELAEDLVEVVFDRAGADEQPGADLGIGEALAGEACDLDLLGGEVLAGLDGALAGPLAGGQQLPIRPRRERLDAHVGKHPVGGAQLLTRVAAATLPPKPLPVLQMSAGQLHANAGSGQALDRLEVEALHPLALAQQRTRARLDAECPVGIE